MSLISSKTMSDQESTAIYYDGRSGKRYEPQITIDDDAISIEVAPNRPAIRWLLSDIRAIEHHFPPEELALGLRSDTAPKLILRPGPLQSRIKDKTPHLYDETVIRKRKLRPLAMIAGFLVLVFGFMFFAGPFLADKLALIMPKSFEQKMADNIRPAIQRWGTQCYDAAAHKILEDLATTLSEGLDLPFPLQIEVRKLGMVNAFALPAGQIIMSGELLKESDNSNEVAGVLAHEIGHVLHRHVVAGIIKDNFIDVAITALTGMDDFGIDLGDGAGMLLQFGYSRDAERSADRTAIELLNRADIKSDGLQSFFAVLKSTRKGPTLSGPLRFLSTHPADEERAERAKTHGTGTANALSDADWKIVQAYCD